MTTPISGLRVSVCVPQAFWLTLWLINNIAVNLFNKLSLSRVDFPYPFFLSGVHMLVCSICAHLYMSYSNIKRRDLDEEGNRFIFIFSLLFAANVAIGNVSLRLVSLKANQVMRSTVPLVVMLVDILFLNKSYPARCASLICAPADASQRDNLLANTTDMSATLGKNRP